MSADLCCVCGRPPHPIDDPQCIHPNAPLAQRLAFVLAENERLRAQLAASQPPVQGSES